MKYLFVRLDEEGFTTKESNDLNEFKEFNHYTTDDTWEKTLSYIIKSTTSGKTFIPFLGNDVKYYIIRNIEEDKTNVENDTNEITYSSLGYNGFDVMLVKDLHIDDDDWKEKFDAYINDETKHEIEFFDSYYEAEAYLINMLTRDNDFYYGLIDYYRYDPDEDNYEELGECEEYICIGEAWSEPIDRFE